MIEAVSGANAVHARTPSDYDRSSGDHRSETGPGWSPDARPAAAEPGGAPAQVITPFIVDSAVRSVESVIAGAPRLSRGAVAGRAIGLYDSAIQAISGSLPADHLGRTLDRTL
jgi:hypothetical protein